MTIEWTIAVLFLIGVVLLVGELLLPTHGVVGVLGLVAIVGGIGYAFRLNAWLGTGLLTGTVLASPLLFALAMKVYPYTPIGKRMILTPVHASTREIVRVTIGDVGNAISDLRPAGQCQFPTGEYEVHSDGPMIEANSTVKVVNVESGRIVVRPV